MKKTKIVCTIGPATESLEMLKVLLENGMNVARLNFSHGNYEEHTKKIKNIKTAVKETGINCALLLDTKGPEIRTKKLKDGEKVDIIKDQKFTFTTDSDFIGNNEKVAVTYDKFSKDLKVGNIVLVDDGLLEMEVIEINGSDVTCIAKNDGQLGENKGINLPGVSIELPPLSEKDIKDLKFACDNNFDFIAASFIRRASDVEEVKKVLADAGHEHIRVIAKIENQEGLDNIDEILESAHGIMVARGDLGVEIPVEDVPQVQKMIIKKCNVSGKDVITATQMLESMIKNPRPTRAEANDVANAILDGTDAIMLSGETAYGLYPVEAVQIMTRIAEKIDPTIKPVPEVRFNGDKVNITSAIAKGATNISEILEAKLLVVATASGRAARDMRRYFPRTEILAITNDEQTAKQVLITRGILSYTDASAKTLDDFYEIAENLAVKLNLAKKGDIIVAACGENVFIKGTINSIKIIEVK